LIGLAQAFAGGVGLGKGPFKTAGALAMGGVTLFQVAGVDLLPPSLPMNWLKGVGLAFFLFLPNTTKLEVA